MIVPLEYALFCTLKHIKCGQSTNKNSYKKFLNKIN